MKCEFCLNIIMPEYEAFRLIEVFTYRNDEMDMRACCNTCYERHISPEPIETRFEILDL